MILNEKERVKVNKNQNSIYSKGISQALIENLRVGLMFFLGELAFLVLEVLLNFLGDLEGDDLLVLLSDLTKIVVDALGSSDKKDAFRDFFFKSTVLLILIDGIKGLAVIEVTFSTDFLD